MQILSKHNHKEDLKELLYNYCFKSKSFIFTVLASDYLESLYNKFNDSLELQFFYLNWI